MLSAELKAKLVELKDFKKVPGVLLITGLYNKETKKQVLISAAEALEEQALSLAKGNLLFLDVEDSATIKVDEVRALLKQISLRNWEPGANRYILIPQAELLTVQSSNALLKSLEEAPEGTHFILGAPSRRSLLKTILSRAFVLSESEVDLESANGLASEAQNIFSEAFFNKNLEPLSKTSKSDIPYAWQEFSGILKERFVSQVYSGELNKSEWHRLFDYMEDMEQKINANIDIKWISSSIERFGFENG